MTRSPQSDAWHSALASAPRRRVLAALTAAAGPLDAIAMAELLGVHVTTARFHLEQLEAGGLVQRQIAKAGQRGRPHILFSPVDAAPAADPQQQLTQALAAVIGEDDDGGRARSVRAGERWSAGYAGTPRSGPAGAGDGAADGLVPPLLRVLDEIGFEPELRPDGTIALPTCPFRQEARLNPDVVCSVHLGLLRGVARSHGYDGAGVRLRPFVQPHLCLVDLPGTGQPT
jgi:predicted ArsR family transcriptional regulator